VSNIIKMLQKKAAIILKKTLTALKLTN